MSSAKCFTWSRDCPIGLATSVVSEVPDFSRHEVRYHALSAIGNINSAAADGKGDEFAGDW
jgi:hypothetical protein